MTRPWLILVVALLGLSAAGPAQAAKKARTRAPKATHAVTKAPAPIAKAAAAPEAPAHTPLAIEDVEIHGERLVPQAIYIVGGPEADAEAAASVSDYLNQLGPATDRMPAALFLTSERR
jgi:hypothetical protein